MSNRRLSTDVHNININTPDPHLQQDDTQINTDDNLLPQYFGTYQPANVPETLPDTTPSTVTPSLTMNTAQSSSLQTVSLSPVHETEDTTACTLYSPMRIQSPVVLTQVPNTNSVIQTAATQDPNITGCRNADNSLDSGDLPFSQEILQSDSSTDASDTTNEMPDESLVVSNEELRLLFPQRMTQSDQGAESGDALCEDIYSGLFYDFDDERCFRIPWECDVLEEVLSLPEVDNEELVSRGRAHQEGGIESWIYDNPFSEVTVRIDDVNDTLETRYIHEANAILDNVTADIGWKGGQDMTRNNEATPVTPLTCVQSFITDCVLEKLRGFANRVLYQQKKKPTSKQELLGLIILHVLCASYNESPSTICDPAESDNFLQIGVSSERYYEVWAALCGSTEKRGLHDYSSNGWCRTANRATSMVAEIEAEIAGVNRELLFVPNATVLSLDDDHLRMASRSVVHLTYLQQHNNSKKGLGPVGNALCSALTSAVIACHFTRKGEKLLHTWERLVQLLQGASTNGAIRTMPDVIFAADRGYNSKEVLEVISDVLGASILGTHKRDLWYPFVFGDGPISKRHRGMVVSERGCRAVYTARLKADYGSRPKARAIEACLYRESCSGRIAALVHNNARLFPSRCFSIVLREAFRSNTAMQRLDEELTVFDSEERRQRRQTAVATVHLTGRQVVDQLLSRVSMLTYHQSEDPIWFLLRAFRFTSRTSHGFLTAVGHDYERRTSGLAWLLRGERLSVGTDVLPQELALLECRKKERWEGLVNTIGIMKRAAPLTSSSQTLADQIAGYSASRMNAMNKSELQKNLDAFDRSIDARATKAQLVAALTQLKADIANGLVDTNGEPDNSTAEQQAEGAAKDLLGALREASLSAWVMKPLVTTAGMREGSMNEVEILKALPKFFEENKGAFTRPLGRSEYTFESSKCYNVKYIRTTGLIESQRCVFLADSPDAVIALEDKDDETTAVAVEIKTMTAIRTIEAASALKEKYGPVVDVSHVGTDERSTAIFQELVNKIDYRTQVLHHAVTLGVSKVLSVVGTGGSMTQGRILYCCLLEFAERIRHHYNYVMDCIRVSGFKWIDEESQYISKEYDRLLKDSHASDLFSFVSYYNLSRSIRRLLQQRESPIPPCRMIRLTPTVYWNHLKGGVDVMSRYLQTLARSNISENPVVSIIARLLSMQVSNAALVYRLQRARQLGILPGAPGQV